jgi:lipopolysaccharide biosynthesis protein
MAQIAVLYHLFYEDTVGGISNELKELQAHDTVFLFNISQVIPFKEDIIKKLKATFLNCHVVISSNRGKDIGGKLMLLSLYLKLKIKSDYLVFLHDKKSLQALNSEGWKNNLMKIVRGKDVKRVLRVFEENPSVGIIATKEYIQHEELADSALGNGNLDKIKRLTSFYQLEVQDSRFVAGTMFWSRASIYEIFFNNYSPIDIRNGLEEGNVLDNFQSTYTHSWERILPWLATTKGYSIVGI